MACAVVEIVIKGGILVVTQIATTPIRMASTVATNKRASVIVTLTA